MLVSSISDAQANGTSPWSIVTPGWAPEPDAGRGTMDIIWTCLVTIFACSWTGTHPQFPQMDGGFLESKIGTCVMAVVAPEVLAYVTFDEYSYVRKHSKAINQMNKGPWTMSQSFFVHMGGVQLEFKDCTETVGTLASGGFNEAKALGDLQRAVQFNLLCLDAISAEDVMSRAKTNHIVKAFVCLQASWLVAQVIGRAVAKLPITTLEVVTTGYVVCALITYFCCWHKPQDAEVFIKVDCRNLTKEEFHQQLKGVPIQGKVFSWWEDIITLMTAGVFGAVHCTAWNFIFATFTESVLWKIASVLTAFLPMIFVAYSNYEQSFPRWLSAHDEHVYSAIIPFYIIIRFYLMVEPFIAFRSVPIGIFYEVKWASWIPHI